MNRVKVMLKKNVKCIIQLFVLSFFCIQAWGLPSYEIDNVDDLIKETLPYSRSSYPVDYVDDVMIGVTEDMILSPQSYDTLDNDIEQEALLFFYPHYKKNIWDLSFYVQRAFALHPRHFLFEKNPQDNIHYVGILNQNKEKEMRNATYVQMNHSQMRIGDFSDKTSVDFTRKFEHRAFVQKKYDDIMKTKVLKPPMILADAFEDVGESRLTAINEQNMIGFVATSVEKKTRDLVKQQCINNEGRLNEICIQKIKYNHQFHYVYKPIIISNIQDLFDDEQEFIEEGGYQYLPVLNDAESHQAYGMSNNSRYIVGVRHKQVIEQKKKGKKIEKIKTEGIYWLYNDQKKQYEIKAFANIPDYIIDFELLHVDDQGIAIGTATQKTKKSLKHIKKYIYVDLNEGSLIKQPHDFEENDVSVYQSYPKYHSYIEDLGDVTVGMIDIEKNNKRIRMKSGFIHQFNQSNEQFIDINTLLTCQARGYELNENRQWQLRYHQFNYRDVVYKFPFYVHIASAEKILDNGDILATANILMPKLKSFLEFDEREKKVKENFVVDENGHFIFRLNGYQQLYLENVSRPVLLRKNKENVPCEMPAFSATKTVDTVKSGSIGYFELLMCLLLIVVHFIYIKTESRHQQKS